MEFVETPLFTRLITALLNDEEYRALQNTLLLNPDAGDVIKNGGWIRKLRHALVGKGKSGGIRTIYYWAKAKSKDQIYMLLAYPKSKKDTLSEQETSILRNLVKDL
jgi:hypothetical protein